MTLKASFYLLILFSRVTNTAFADEGAHDSYRGTYAVKQAGIGISEVAEILYGHYRIWKKIAVWNHLVEPYTIQLGSHLLLRKKPAIPLEQADLKTTEYWDQNHSKKAVLSRADAAQPSDVAQPGLSSASNTSAMRRPAGIEAEATPDAEAIKAKAELYLKHSDLDQSYSTFEVARQMKPNDVEVWVRELKVLKLQNSPKLPELLSQFKAQFPQLVDLAFVKSFE